MLGAIKKHRSSNKMIIKLWNNISKRRQKQFWLLLLLMVAASLSEVVSIGAILPFLGVLTAPEQVYHHQIMQPLIDVLGFSRPDQLILPITIIFIIAVLIAAIIRLILLYALTRLSVMTGSDLSIDIYQRTLYQDYSVHIERNSSEVINGIITKTSTVINGVLTPVLTLISSTILLIGIMSALFMINIQVALLSSVGFGLIYFGVIRYVRKRIKENSQCVAEQSTIMIKSLQEGLGGIRDVLIDGSQNFYCQLYRDADLPLRLASGNNTFISGSPRYIVESLGMVLIAVIAYTMTQQENGISTTIPVLGALALGAQRLLPASQQAYASYSSIKISQASFDDVIRLLDQKLPNYAGKPLPDPIRFEKTIDLVNVSFRYTEDTAWVHKNLNLNLRKGERIGFIGATGSGKSTLLDIIMGLHHQTAGKLMVDNNVIDDVNRRAWQVHIAHVPQHVYLSDSTIEENIAFGIPTENISHKRVTIAAKKAQIKELIEGWKEGYQTYVGERGVRLSGGQRQRIGIARALYKQADVLILDEATSSLDDQTEEAVMGAIDGLERDLTILIIAHRLTTLRGCDKIVKLNKDRTIDIIKGEGIVEITGGKE